MLQEKLKCQWQKPQLDEYLSARKSDTVDAFFNSNLQPIKNVYDED